MASSNHRWSFWNGIFLFGSGLAVGWLVGLSLSPVLQVVVASIVALTVAATSALAGLSLDAAQPKDGGEPAHAAALVLRSRVTLLPLCLMTVGIAFGASGGILARTNNLLGLYPEISSKRWTGTGIPQNEIQSRMFNELYSTNHATTSTEATNVPASAETKPGEQEGAKSNQWAAGLFAVRVDACGLLALKQGAELRTRLKALNDPAINSAVAKCSGDDCLVAIREMLCHGT